LIFLRDVVSVITLSSRRSY